MKLACPYCGRPIGDGAPTHLTPIRYKMTGSSYDFRMINLDEVHGLAPPRSSSYRAIQSCPAEACKAKAAEVQP